jgi:glycerol-3-phosphate dehydrogenase
MERRDIALARLANETFDLLVIGGGITGAGVALDAVTRGMRVALVEGVDYASGTSSRSTKLVHGGVRYLAQRDIGLVREALAERHLLLHLAPHLVHPQPFVLPVYRGQHVPGVRAPAMATMALTAAGLAAYDLLAGTRGLQRHHRLSPLGARGLVPHLRSAGLRGAFLYYDARTDDVRLVLAVLAAAVARGAAIANHLEVVGFERQNGRLAAAAVRDRLGEHQLLVRAARVVNATGAWSGRVAALAGSSARPLRLSKGVHLVVDRASLPLGPLAVVLPVTADGRLAFAVPWGNQVLLGTTDTPYEGDPAMVYPEPADVAALLDDANRFLDLRLSIADVVGAFAGLRPLVASDAPTTATTSREHAVAVAPSGLVSVTGGKLTTYRRVARDTVDAALRAVPGPWGPSRTAHVMLQGAPAPATARHVRTSAGRSRVNPDEWVTATRAKAAELSLPTPVAAHLVATYGADAQSVLALVAQQPSLGPPLVPGLPYLQAEVVYAARYEGAQTLEDVLRRRTRVALEDREGGLAAASDAAALLAAELGWDAARRQRELEGYRAHAAAARRTWLRDE